MENLKKVTQKKLIIDAQAKVNTSWEALEEKIASRNPVFQALLYVHAFEHMSLVIKLAICLTPKDSFVINDFIDTLEPCLPEQVFKRLEVKFQAKNIGRVVNLTVALSIQVNRREVVSKPIEIHISQASLINIIAEIENLATLSFEKGIKRTIQFLSLYLIDWTKFSNSLTILKIKLFPLKGRRNETVF